LANLDDAKETINKMLDEEDKLKENL